MNTPTPEEVEALVAEARRAATTFASIPHRQPESHLFGRLADALTASSSQPVGESRGDAPSLRDVTEAAAESVLMMAEEWRSGSLATGHEFTRAQQIDLIARRLRRFWPAPTLPRVPRETKDAPHGGAQGGAL